LRFSDAHSFERNGWQANYGSAAIGFQMPIPHLLSRQPLLKQFIHPNKRTIVPGTPYVNELECFDNSYPDREYSIEIVCPEFTSICPKTGQPDFGTLTFRYVPDKKCVELKSLKLYLQRFRNEGIFYENVTNRIFDDFLAVVAPKRAELESRWGPRGGITSVITVQHP
jgi:7-cyano-7-deazaguanine reductase